LEVCDDIIRIDPSNRAARADKAITLDKLGRTEEAVAEYDAALMLDGNDKMIWNKKGLALVSLGRHGEAVQAFDSAFNLDPNDSRTLDNAGRAYLLQHNHPSALDLRALHQHEPRSGAIPFRQRQGPGLLERYDEAIGAFDKALPRPP
jgi:tetratricopeptide (TPR) repeat protein